MELLVKNTLIQIENRLTYINTIILLKSVDVNKLQVEFLLDRLGTCLKLVISTENISCHEFASQFGLAIFYTRKTPKTIANTESPVQRFIWMKQRPAIVRRSRTIDRLRQRTWAATTAIIVASDWAKMATMRGYTFTAWKMWFRNYYVVYAFVYFVYQQWRIVF